jgi:hypothetical protein
VEYWVAEVEQVLGQPGQNPKQRAEAFVAIKQCYQQEVLGMQNGGGVQ